MIEKYFKSICLASLLIALNLVWVFPSAAKSICGEQSCYGCCNDNCDNTVLDKRDIGRKEIKKAIKACKAGCNSVHWTGSTLSGRLRDNAQEKLGKYCAENEPLYSGYCMRAFSLWGKNCDSKAQSSETDEDTRTSDIDQKWNGFESSVKEDIAKSLIKNAFPSLTDITIVTLMNRSDITRGVRLSTLTTPLSMAQGLQQIINRISKVEGMIPVHKLDSLEEISAALTTEIENIEPGHSPPSPSSASVLGKYEGLDDDAVFSTLNQDLQDVMAMVSKQDISSEELKAGIKKLMRIYDQLEQATDDPALQQMIGQVKATFQQLLDTM